MTTRRGFLGALIAGGAAALALDPERALWVPGKKTISVPPAPRVCLRYMQAFYPQTGQLITRLDARVVNSSFEELALPDQQVDAAVVVARDFDGALYAMRAMKPDLGRLNPHAIAFGRRLQKDDTWIASELAIDGHIDGDRPLRPAALIGSRL